MSMGIIAAPPAPAPQATPAPAAPVAEKVTHAPSPFIPPLRKQPEQVTEPEPAKLEVEAKPAEPEPEVKAEDDSDTEIVAYDPTDEFDVVINGKAGTVTLGKLIASYQRGEAANAKFNAAKEMEHRAIGLVRDMTTPDGFVRAMQQLKADPYRIAEDIILARADLEAMTPEQREIERYKRERAEWERQRAEESKRSQQTQAERETAQQQARLLDAMSSTLDRLQVSEPGLRNEIVQRAAGILRSDYESGIETTPQQAIQEAWDDYRARLAAHARALPVGERVSAEEKARLAEEARQQRVRVAPTAPKVQATQPRDDGGKFVSPAKPQRFDMWSPGGKR